MAIVTTDTNLTSAASQRPALERFIAERFRQAYGAQLSHFCTYLLGLRDSAGAWQAAAGYTPAASGALYLEHYLDRPVEVVLSAAVGERVPREGVVEVGNLASAARGFGGRFLPALRRTLVDLGYVWAVFTATREVRGILEHFAFDARVLAPATPAALPDGGTGWGTYYAHEPRVMAGCIR
jgi:hypothetical protein